MLAAESLTYCGYRISAKEKPNLARDAVPAGLMNCLSICIRGLALRFSFLLTFLLSCQALRTKKKVEQNMVSFDLTSSETAARSVARIFATTHLAPAKSTYQSLPAPESRFQSLKPTYEAAVRAGLLKAQIPAPVGGTSTSLVEAAILVEELYAVEASASLTILGTGLGLTPLCLTYRPELREFLQPFLSGQGAPLASLVFSEPAGVVRFSFDPKKRGYGFV